MDAGEPAPGAEITGCTQSRDWQCINFVSMRQAAAINHVSIYFHRVATPSTGPLFPCIRNCEMIVGLVADNPVARFSYGSLRSLDSRAPRIWSMRSPLLSNRVRELRVSLRSRETLVTTVLCSVITCRVADYWNLRRRFEEFRRSRRRGRREDFLAVLRVKLLNFLFLESLASRWIGQEGTLHSKGDSQSPFN